MSKIRATGGRLPSHCCGGRRRTSALALLPILALGLVLRSCAPPDEDFYLGGIQVDEADTQLWLDSLQRAGMNTVSVTVYARQAEWDSDRLTFDETAEGILAEMRFAKQRGLRVAMIPRVSLDDSCEQNRFMWHGMIMPATEAVLDSWFRRYQRFVLEWARVAEEEGVDLLAVGSELSSLSSTVPLQELPPLEEYYLNLERQVERRAKALAHSTELDPRRLWARGGADRYSDLEDYLDARISAERTWARQTTFHGQPDPIGRINARRRRLEERWGRLIEAVRGVFSGELTYAANFDQYQAVTFWNLLDYIGINAYFPLRDQATQTSDPRALAAQLERSWETILGDLLSFRRQRSLDDKPVVFTEIGYTSRANSTLQPWAGDGFSVLDAESGPNLLVWDDQPAGRWERALAIEALHRAHEKLGSDLLRGILYWKLSTHPEHVEIEPFVLVLDSGDPLLAALRRFS